MECLTLANKRNIRGGQLSSSLLHTTSSAARTQSSGDVPASRRVRVLAFDPSLSTRLETNAMNQLTLSLPWEDSLEPGPVGEYLEVIDYDPASQCFYEPVDLNSPYLLATDGLSPSESNPQFHQQMVYGVAMTTIRNFERALGRVVFWGDYRKKLDGPQKGKYVRQFVRRLRIYPHALRERNAYYSPEKKSVLFGYFPATTRDANSVPGTVVFTCLSHDIIAHEVTHALLDGVHPRFNEPTNPDVHAFHEAFADIVALFQHFSYPSVLAAQISKTRGNLETQNLLSQLAQQFGRATGRGSALRDALGGINEATGEWEPRKPDPRALSETFKPHDRGSILVAAVFRAFLLIYRARTADLFRIATGGTGVLPEGELHPDLTNRLANEAARCADRVLQMCIRAIDYCPPVDITFGDFLRAIVTADLDYSPSEEDGYRTVFTETFREWGIHPRGITSLGLDGFVWPKGEALLRELRGPTWTPDQTRIGREELNNKFLRRTTELTLLSDRYEVWKLSQELKKSFWEWLKGGDQIGQAYAEVFGLLIKVDPDRPTVHMKDGYPAVEIHSVRPTIRRTAAGGTRVDLVVEITQRRRGYFESEEQRDRDRSGSISDEELGDFTYRAGCTILIDPATQEIRRVIRTPGTITDDEELERIRKFLTGEVSVTGNAFDAGLPLSMTNRPLGIRNEPFALLHLGEV